MAFVGTVCSHVQGGSISTVSTSKFGYGRNESWTYLAKSPWSWSWMVSVMGFLMLRLVYILHLFFLSTSQFLSLSNCSPFDSFSLQRILLVIFCDSSKSILHNLILIPLKFITTGVLGWECSYKIMVVFSLFKDTESEHNAP